MIAGRMIVKPFNKEINRHKAFAELQNMARFRNTGQLASYIGLTPAGIRIFFKIV
jgi:hypothetical protein